MVNELERVSGQTQQVAPAEIIIILAECLPDPRFFFFSSDQRILEPGGTGLRIVWSNFVMRFAKKSCMCVGVPSNQQKIEWEPSPV